MLAVMVVRMSAVTHYVNLNCTNPVVPYTSWDTAATNLQQAASLASGGDTILVTNGVYQDGSAPGARISIFNNVTVQSVNGPAATIIKGTWDTTTNGPNALRCAYLSAGSVLSGFTLTNGATTISGVNSGGGVYCASSTAIVTNCVIIGNSAYSSGGGAYSGTLINCSLVGNSASPTAGGGGGGANNSTLINCLLARNFSGYSSGGAGLSTLINCTVVSNVAAAYAGAGWDNTFKNSIVYYNNSYYNRADDSGGYGNWTNCCIPFTVTSGVNNLTNPPLFANLAAGDYHLNATSPCINAGNNSFITNATDLDGNPRIVGGIVDLGAYEFQSPVRYVNVGNPTPVSPFTNWLTAAANIQDAVDASTNGDLILVTNGIYQTGASLTSDGASNRVVVHKAVTLESVNGPSATVIAGVYARLSSVRCVYLTDGAALLGFTLAGGGSMQSGGGAWCEDSNVIVSNCVVTNGFVIQNGGGICGGKAFNCILMNNSADQYGGGAFQGALFDCVLTNNHAYYGGGACSNTLVNCALVGNFAQFQNLNSGGGAIYSILSNCVVAGNDSWGGGGGAAFSILTGCTVSNNTANVGGGGLCTGFAINCVISSNQTMNIGGGAYSNTLVNCVLKNNLAGSIGGGAYQSTLVDCTVISNAASGPSVQPTGGGLYGGSATNCIIYDNLALKDPNVSGSAPMVYCCTTPLPAGSGNITNEPAVLDLANADFHLQSNSPCINAGNNACVSVANDLDGNPRIVGSTVDIGAYEYQTPTSVLSYAWAQQYGLPTDGSVDYADLDGTSFNVYQDWIAGLNPTNALSVLAMLPPTPTNNPAGLVVSWESVSNITYFLQSSTNLGAQPAFSTIQSNLLGQAGTTSYTDTNAVGNGPFFYRVGVQQ